MVSSQVVYNSTKSAATPTRSARSIRRKAVDGSGAFYSKKISGAWIICRGRDIPADLIGVEEAARRLHRSKRRVQQLCRRGELNAQKVGGVWLVKLR
jgi:excisionase family DNA binding protein